MSEIQKFDPNSLMQGVRDKIKSSFVDLIPDEQWNQMVQKEIDDFFQPKSTNNYNEYKSNFQILIRNVLNEDAKQRLIDILNSPEYQENWNYDGNGNKIASHAISNLIINSSGIRLKYMFG